MSNFVTLRSVRPWHRPPGQVCDRRVSYADWRCFAEFILPSPWPAVVRGGRTGVLATRRCLRHTVLRSVQGRCRRTVSEGEGLSMIFLVKMIKSSC